MANPLHDLFDKKAAAAFYSRMASFVVGIVQDLWKDGSEDPFEKFKPAKPKFTPRFQPQPAHTVTSSVELKNSSREWHAAPGEISEKMWGEGFVAPGDDVISEMLIKPLGLNKQMSVLDLSAGLGERMRKATAEFGAYITGLEPDPGIAARGMEMLVMTGKGKHAAITHYVPSEFIPGKTVTRIYDCVIARETFYLVANKQEFFAALTVCTKPQAQITFTDYIVNPEDRDKPAVVEWLKHEPGASPLGLIEMAEAWAKAGFKLRVHDDQSEYYHKEILAGLKRFALFIKSSLPPDLETRGAILRRMEIWGHRLAAMDQGMKFYRFYGTK